MNLTDGMIKALMPTVRKLVTDDKLVDILHRITAGIPEPAGCKNTVIPTEKNGKLVFSVVTIENMHILKIHKQYTVEDLQKLLNP